MNTYIDDKHYSYHHPFALVDFRGFSHSQFSKPLSTVAKTESLVDLANFVKLCLINYSLELHFLSRVNILAMLVDIVAPGLAVGDEFLGELLILTISNDLLYKQIQDKMMSKMSFYYGYLLAIFRIRAINVSRLLLDLV